MTIFATTRTVKFQDVDAAGIVFFPKIHEYFHDAYFKFLQVKGIDIAQMIAEGKYLLPLVHSEADFHKPLRFGHVINVAIKTITTNTSSFAVKYEITNKAEPCITHCTGKTVHAVVKRADLKPCKHIPKQIQQVLHSKPLPAK